MQPVKKGDIYYDSWGYDQTNIDFIIVEEVSRTGKTALCRMMSQKIVEYETSMSERILPDKPYGGPFRLYVREGYRGDPVLRGSYPFCEGSKRFGHFWKFDGKPKHQSHWH